MRREGTCRFSFAYSRTFQKFEVWCEVEFDALQGSGHSAALDDEDRDEDVWHGRRHVGDCPQ